MKSKKGCVVCRIVPIIVALIVLIGLFLFFESRLIGDLVCFEPHHGCYGRMELGCSDSCSVRAVLATVCFCTVVICITYLFGKTISISVKSKYINHDINDDMIKMILNRQKNCKKK